MITLWRKIKNGYNNLGIQKKLIFALLILVLTPMLVIGVFFYTRLYNMIVSDTIRNEQKRAAQTGPLVEDSIHEIINVHRTLRSSDFYKSLTSENRIEDLHALANSTDAQHFNQDVLHYSSMESISAVRIYVDCDESELPYTAGKKYSTMQPLSSVKGTYWYGIFQGSPAQATLLCPSFYLGSYEIQNYGDLAYVTKDSITQNGKKVACYMVTYFSNTYLTQLLTDNITTEENVAYLINSRDNLVATSDPSLYGTYSFSSSEIRNNIMSSNNFITKQILGKKVYAGFYRIDNTDWYMVVVMPVEPIMQKSTNLIFTFLLIYLAFLLLAFLIATGLARSLTNRLSLVVDQMAKVKYSPPVELPDADSQDEIGELIDTYNYMSRKIKRLMDDQAKTAENLRIAEFDSLQSQINPHFLYNTMDMISWLAQQGKTDEVSDVVRRLSRFYRLTLSHKGGLTTIADEVEHVTIYIDLQNMRFNNGIDFIMDIPDYLMEYSIPKLLFQPLAENSIVHGIMEKEEKTGSIVLTGWMEDEDIVILLSDDGVGIAPETISGLLNGRFQSPKSKGTNIAVYNTHRRLQILYGNRYGLNFTSTPGKGTEVQIRIPAILPEDTGNPEGTGRPDENTEPIDNLSPDLLNSQQEEADSDSGNPEVQVQLAQAVTMMSDPGLSLYEIVWKCGYQNLDEFYTDFQDSYGYTPEEYRMHFL